MLKIAVSKAVTGGVDAVTILPPYMYSTLHTLPACLGLWRQIKLYTTIQQCQCWCTLGLGVVHMENRDNCTIQTAQSCMDELNVVDSICCSAHPHQGLVHPAQHATPHCTNYLITW